MNNTPTVLSYINIQIEQLEESVKPYKINSLSCSYINGQIMALMKLRDKIRHSEVM